MHVLVRVCVAEMPVVRNRPKGLGWMGDRRVARHAYGETDGSSLNHRATRRETRRRQLPCLLLSGRPLKLARRAHHVKQLGHWWRAHIGGLVFFLFPLAKAKLVSTTLCCETFLQQPKFKDFSLFFFFFQPNDCLFLIYFSLSTFPRFFCFSFPPSFFFFGLFPL